MNGFYRFARNLVGLIGHIIFRVKYYGVENIPETGGLIAAGNHRTSWDPIFMAVGIKKRQVFYMAKAEFFKYPIIKQIFNGLGAYPVRRGRGDRSALDAAIDVVKKEQIMGIFPEGTRNKDGEDMKPQTGVALIAAASGGDVMPVSIYCEGKVRIFKKITVRFGKPIPNADICPSTVLTSQERKYAARYIMERIVEMLELGHEKWK